MMKKILFEDALILSVARCSSFLLRLLPIEATLWMGRRIGDAIYFVSKRRRIAHKNLRAAFASEYSPERIECIARGSFQTMAMSAVELLRFPTLDDAYIHQNLVMTGRHHFEPYLKRGRGVIFLTGHFGNWELIGVAGNLLGRPVVALARKQKHPRSDEFLNRLRASRGTQMILKGMPVRELLRALQASKIVGMLSDQDGGKNGAKVFFFGRNTSTPRGVAAFALRTEAPIFPVFVVRQEGSAKHRIEVEAPLKMPEATAGSEEAERDILQQFTEILESKIRKDPAQWLWAHRRWKSAPERRVLILNDGKSGHLNQSFAVLNALVEERRAIYPEAPSGFVSHTVVHARYRGSATKMALRAAVLMFGQRFPFRRALLRRALTQACYQELMAQAPDVVISCGSQNAALNLLISQENDARSAAILKPLESSASFRAVIVPRHDRIKPSANVFVTETALSAIDETRMREESERLEFEFPGLKGDGRRRIGFLVGGDTEKNHLDRGRFERVLREILRYRLDENAVLLATSSRRTPAWANELLKKDLGNRGTCALLVIANEANRPGVVAGILGLSDALIVSGESISMVSEAVWSGKPVTVFIPSCDKTLKSRHREFLDGLRLRRLITVSEPEFLYDTLKNGSATANGALTRCLESDRQTLRAAAARLLS